MLLSACASTLAQPHVTTLMPVHAAGGCKQFTQSQACCLQVIAFLDTGKSIVHASSMQPLALTRSQASELMPSDRPHHLKITGTSRELIMRDI